MSTRSFRRRRRDRRDIVLGWLAVVAVSTAGVWLTLTRLVDVPAGWAGFAAGAAFGLAAGPVARRGWLAALAAVGLAPARRRRRR